MSRIAAAVFSLAVLTSPALANDWYVDTVNGSDSNSGTLAADAWRTLSYARTQVPVGAAETIHLAPGIYAEFSSFNMVPRWRIVADGGSALTTFNFYPPAAGGFNFTLQQPGLGFGPDSELRGLTINALNQNAISLGSDGELSPTLVDLQINGAATGVWFSHSSSVAGTSSPTFERLRISNCFNGFLFTAFSPNMNFTPRFLDCEISSCTNLGLYFSGRQTAVDAKRCKFVMNSAAGVWFNADGMSLGGVFEDCLFAKHTGAGIRADFAFAAPPSSVDVTLRRCTVADNAQFGVRGTSTGLLAAQIRLEGTIVARNGDDLLVDPIALVSYSCIEDGDFAGSNGNFSADPAFVNAAGGNYQLSWASACVDRGNPLSPVGAVDLAGQARPIDGNLDTIEVADVGAFEFTPLGLSTDAQSGSIARFAFSGEQGTSSLLYFTRQAIGSPRPTMYGEYDLVPFARLVLRTTVGAGSPVIVQRAIPSGSGWIGQTLAYQALTRSSVAPFRAAYTNAVQFTILP